MEPAKPARRGRPMVTLELYEEVSSVNLPGGPRPD